MKADFLFFCAYQQSQELADTAGHACMQGSVCEFMASNANEECEAFRIC